MNRTLKLTLTALMAALCVITNIFEVNLSIYKISFTYIPTFFTGVLLGPVAGLIAGGVGDILGILINSQGAAFNPFFTLSTMLMGFIPGIVFKFSRLNPLINTVISFILTYLVCTLGINTMAIYFYYLAPGKYTYLAWLGKRISLQSPVVAINLAICLFLYYPVTLQMKSLLRRNYKKIKR